MKRRLKAITYVWIAFSLILFKLHSNLVSLDPEEEMRVQYSQKKKKLTTELRRLKNKLIACKEDQTEWKQKKARQLQTSLFIANLSAHQTVKEQFLIH